MKQSVNRMAAFLSAIVFSVLCAATAVAEVSFSPGAVSQFWFGGTNATVVGVSGLAWSDFAYTDDYGTKVFIDADIVDAEKTAKVDWDDYWCVPMSDMDALFITGWARATPYANVDAMVNYFRSGANHKLLQYPDSGAGKYDVLQGTYGAGGIFTDDVGAKSGPSWFKATTKIDIAPYVTNGILPSTAGGAATALGALMDKGEYVARVVVGFGAPNNNKSIWSDVETGHGVLCVGYAKAGGNLVGLFIIDPDNDQCATAGGGAKAPNSIAYCPVSLAGGTNTISGIWGQESELYLNYCALQVPLSIDTYPVYYTDNDGAWSTAWYGDITNYVRSVTAPTVTLSGLPSGLTYKNGVISGKAKKAGTKATVTISAYNTLVKKPLTKKFTLVVDNFTNAVINGEAKMSQFYNLNAGLPPAGMDEVISNLTANSYAVTFSGLPGGISYNKNKGKLTGVATKEGSYTVTVTATKGSEKNVATTTFSVWFPQLELSADYCADAASTNSAKFVGAGKYPAGKKVSLRATPAKGNVFVGWYDAGANLLSKTAAYQYTTADVATNLTAKFATAEEDAQSLNLVLPPEYKYEEHVDTNGTFKLPLGVPTSLTPATLTVAGLPAGLTYKAKDGAISGKTTKVGAFAVKVSGRNTSVTKAKVLDEFVLRVANVTKDWSVAANLESTNDYQLVAGDVASVSNALTTVVSTLKATGYTNVSFAGLPPGVTYNANTGTFKGVATKEGYFNVTISVKKAGGKTETATTTFFVDYPELTLSAVDSGDPASTNGVKLVGAGKYQSGKKVALRATPVKGGVFAGWYDAGANLLSKTAAYQYTTADVATNITAKFATTAEDAANLAIVGLGAEYSYETVAAADPATNGTFHLAFKVTSLTPATVAVAGLPAGLKYDAKAEEIVGKKTAATKPGAYVVIKI